MESFSYIAGGEGAQGASTPQELEERLRILEEKVRRDAREIVEVLKVDFPLFVERTVKDRFLAERDLAAGMSQAAIKSLKADVAAAGQKAVGELVPPLEDAKIWLDVPAVPPAAERRDLQGNAEVNGRIQRVGQFVRELLERYKFPGVREEDFAQAYKLPAWFIAGRLLKSLVESYWRNLEEHHAVREALRQMKEREERASLAERWDSA